MAIIEETNKEGIQNPLRLDFEVVQTLKIIEFDSGRAALKRALQTRNLTIPDRRSAVACLADCQSIGLNCR